MYNVGLIDSLKLRVKLDKVKVIDKRLTSEYVRFYNDLDGFDDDLQRADPMVRIINGITYRFYTKAYITPTKAVEEYVVFQISAKMAKKDYFSGITALNIIEIIKDINALRIVEITEFNFLQGLVSDIDICINQLIDMKSLLVATSFIREFPQPSKKPLIHFISKTNNLNRPYNLGVDFNKREKATNTTPYCKIYHKGLELTSKSVDFYNAYLAPMKASVIDNLVRYEFTIKHHKHKEFLRKKELLKSDLKTLKDLLSIQAKELTEIAKCGLKYYLEPRSQPKLKTAEGLTPTEIVITYYISELIGYGFDKENLLAFAVRINCPTQKSVTKSRIKKLIQWVLEENQKLKTKEKLNETANEFLKKFGW